MNREFLEYYERELRLLYERSRDFAAEFPGIAERLGGLTEEKMDPGLAGLLEGSAFLAARVQLKLKSEFSEFTTALVDQLLPTYLAPIPSAVLVQATPKFDDPNLRNGITYPAGSYMDAVYVERERRVACRYRLGSDLTIWPLRLEKAEYFSGPAPLQALGLEVGPGTMAGMRLSFMHRIADPARDVEGKPGPGAPVDTLRLDTLPVHLVGNSGDVGAVYEQLFAHCRRITLRYEDGRGDPVFLPLRLEQLQQLGFDEKDALYPKDERFFAGFELLREFFAFPAKFTGFKLQGLQALLARVPAQNFDLLFEFDAALARLAPVVNAGLFCLYGVAASNLFEMTCSRIPVSSREYEHLVVPDRSRWLDFETHRILEVSAHYAKRVEKQQVFPLYSLPTSNIRLSEALYYTTRRLQRQPTERERRFGTQSNYAGTETFLSLYEPAGLDDEDRVKELGVRALVSNRHLTEQLPVGDAGADFRLADDTSVDLRCVVGPTPPRDSLIHMERRQRDSTRPGPMLWRLINLLALNHLGLIDRSEGDKAGGLKELLALFADLDDSFGERQVRGIESVETRPIVRRLRQANGFNAARGMEITITLDEKAFEGSGVMVLGAVLDRFLAEYTSINSFTQTVIASAQRGVIMRWPPRSGLGGVL